MKTENKGKATNYLARYGQLTDDEVKSLYKVLPPILIAMAFGQEYADAFCESCRRAEMFGAKLYFVWWPDGALMTYLVTNAEEPIDPENLLKCYRAGKALEDAYRKGNG